MKIKPHIICNLSYDTCMCKICTETRGWELELSKLHYDNPWRIRAEEYQLIRIDLIKKGFFKIII